MFSGAPLVISGAGSSAANPPHVSHHPQIEKSFSQCVASVIKEWNNRGDPNFIPEPLDLTCTAAKNLLIALDNLLSNGYLSGDRAYWRFIRDFLPKSECEYIRREWHVVSDRESCLAWLKDSLNRQIIVFYFESFLRNRTLVRKYYSSHAVMRNRQVMERISKRLSDTESVHFAFSMPSRKQLQTPIAQLRSPSLFRQMHQSTSSLTRTPKRHSSVRSTSILDESVADVNSVTDSMLDIPLPANLVEAPSVAESGQFYSTPKDFEYVFEEILHKNEILSRTELFSQPSTLSAVESALDPSITSSDGHLHDDKGSTSPASTNSEPKIGVKSGPNPFDLALKSSLSQAKVDYSNTMGALSDKHIETPLSVAADMSPVGEIKLDMGEVVGISINIFKNENEKFLRFFQVFIHFGTGEPERRYAVLSDHSVYILSKNEEGPAANNFRTCAHIPLDNVEYISIGPEHQSLFFHSLKEPFMDVDERDGVSRCIEICTASSRLGITMADAVSAVYSDLMSLSAGKQHKLDVLTEMTPQYLMLRKFMAKELKEEKIDLKFYCQALWRQSDCTSSGNGYLQRSGFLYHRTYRCGPWLSSSSDYEQSFFLLSGKKLYQFSDSTCRIGQRIFSMDNVVSTTEVSGEEKSPNVIQMDLDSGENIRFICQSHDDLQKWLTSLLAAVSSAGEGDGTVACIIAISTKKLLVAQEGLRFAVDGFMRTLMLISFEEIQKVTTFNVQGRYVCVLRGINKLDWLFVRSADELCRLMNCIKNYVLCRSNSQKIYTNVDNCLSYLIGRLVSSNKHAYWRLSYKRNTASAHLIFVGPVP
ncbi:hypothetical protein AB6A40_000784 [Gnathostoma spinigerum]|uniref:Uncharacterized protein n=1 Tax=Gnathostoma spinigerum TaxID=75299 RepID=A0ABD6E2R7_9BILA